MCGRVCESACAWRVMSVCGVRVVYMQVSACVWFISTCVCVCARARVWQSQGCGGDGWTTRKESHPKCESPQGKPDAPNRPFQMRCKIEVNGRGERRAYFSRKTQPTAADVNSHGSRTREEDDALSRPLLAEQKVLSLGC